MKEGDIIKHPFRPINVRIEYTGDKVYKFKTKQGIGYEAIEGSKQYNELDKDPRFIKTFFKNEPSVEIDLSTEIESKTMVMPEREALKYKIIKEEIIMKRDVNILLEAVLKESAYSIEDVQKAIDTQTPMTITKAKISDQGSTLGAFNVVPEEINGNIIIGESNEQGRIEFKLEDVEQILFLDEALTPGIHMKADALGQMDTTKLTNLAKTAPIEITEDEEPESGDHVLDYVKRDMNNLYPEDKEQEEKTDSAQELSIFNINTWANQLEIDLGDIHNFNKGIQEYQFLVGDKPYTVLIHEDGTIRLSGHIVRSFDDFKKIIEFQKTF